MKMATKKLDWVLKNLWFNLKLSGWIPTAAGALMVGGFLTVYTISHAGIDYLRRIIEVVIPLAFGLHAAFVLAPENEPAIELLLSYPKPLARLLGERILTISILHGSVALTATLLIAVNWNVESLGLALIRWLAAGVILGGLAVFTTQLTRQSAFGALMATFLWASSIYGGDALLRRWPWAWPAHIYLQPENVSLPVYILNRFILVLVGLALMFLAGVLLRDDERTLGSK
jgi:hypothetical protein